MFVLTPPRLADYAASDRIGRLLADETQPGDEAFVSQRWLQESLPKRLMYECIYGDLLGDDGPRRRILDVAGGFCALTRRLLTRHDYTLVEISAHDAATALRAVERSLGRQFWVEGDWWAQAGGRPWDVVIANDLFPNVDQRLAMFLEKFLSLAGEIRLSLTYYDEPRFYFARRVQGEEVLCVLAWTGQQTREVLECYLHRAVAFDGKIPTDAVSVFPNGRQVLIARLRGDVST